MTVVWELLEQVKDVVSRSVPLWALAAHCKEYCECMLRYNPAVPFAYLKFHEPKQISYSPVLKRSLMAANFLLLLLESVCRVGFCLQNSELVPMLQCVDACRLSMHPASLSPLYVALFCASRSCRWWRRGQVSSAFSSKSGQCPLLHPRWRASVCALPSSC